MKPKTWMRVRELFERALELPKEERGDLLDTLCRGDRELRQEVDELLTEESKSVGFMSQAVRVAPDLLVQRDQCFEPGTRIGHYEIVRVIASGGMGTVYEAIQDEPRRSVALKILRSRMGSDAAIQRLREEARVLAKLKHPGVAQIFEAGTHQGAEFSTPYFAMELVDDATTILEYAAELDRKKRLQLFLQLCEAVHHGHQQGVVHRDLKPGNILVNREGRVKVIDFGISIASGLDGESETRSSSLAGTLPYMSLEQLEGSPDQIDTRADVYALGVVLYQLLSGALPFNLETLRFKAAAKLIRETAAPRLGELDSTLRGDLEYIAVRALERNREQRYSSAAELAADISHHLAHEPVAAHPQSTSYLTSRYVRRHAVLVSATAAVILTLVAGLGWSLYERSRAIDANIYAQNETRVAIKAREAEAAQRLLAEEARDEANRQEQRAVAAAEAANAARHLAEDEGKRANEATLEARRQEARATQRARLAMVSETILDQMLSQLDPSINRGQEPTVRQFFDSAVIGIDAQQATIWPLAEAEVRETFAETYTSMGRHAEAEVQARRSYTIRLEELGLNHIETLVSAKVLVNALLNLKRFEEVIELAQTAHKSSAQTLGIDSYNARFFQDVLARALIDTGRLEDALPLCREAVDASLRAFEASGGRENLLIGMLNSIGNLTLGLEKQGELEEAEVWAGRAVSIAAEHFPEHDDALLTARTHFARVLIARDNKTSAKTILDDVVGIRRSVYGAEDPRTKLAEGLFELANDEPSK
ncbi:MAG: serine/threonine protein kinase/tetratricopeptide (TPR) repeat protein [Planctomycetota bacterium]|jgi:serine/threonine protein kinase/tetratricopeptide (TPR) repeat protein